MAGTGGVGIIWVGLDRSSGVMPIVRISICHIGVAGHPEFPPCVALGIAIVVICIRSCTGDESLTPMAFVVSAVV
jgi:hypothetical protein